MFAGRAWYGADVIVNPPAFGIPGTWRSTHCPGRNLLRGLAGLNEHLAPITKDVGLKLFYDLEDYLRRVVLWNRLLRDTRQTYLDPRRLGSLEAKPLDHLVHRCDLRKNHRMQAFIAWFRRCALFVAHVYFRDELRVLHPGRRYC